ncbi:ATP-binding cassette domain-containing protein [Paenibacillus sp. sgz500958]|uniref:ATP-binding cassette domain-containing protein n=1 Tax=Paenibacillus sp. sgz500958 TaxID=3242475 RepID=UPI0036D31D16
MSEEVLLRMENVSKSFPVVKALREVSFTLRRGEIHALMGENGAGKSTLIKVLTGVYEMDEGSAYLAGQRLQISSPQDAQDAGISTVYQEINLCANLTVAENIYIGRLPKNRAGIDWNSDDCREAQSGSGMQPAAWTPVHQGCRYGLLPRKACSLRYRETRDLFTGILMYSLTLNIT